MEQVKFQQNLTPEDLIAYNCYLATRRSNSSLMTRILGLFLIVMGIVDFFRPTPQYVMCVVIILFGVFGLFFLNPLLLMVQKNTIRKKITQNFRDVLMNVTVSEDGILFEVPEDEESKQEEKEEENYYGEIHTVKPVDEVMSNEEACEQEAEQISTDEVKEEEIKQETESVEEEVVTEEPFQEENKKINGFMVPWTGITKIVDDGVYMFINMPGFQSMLIKKEACETIEEVIAYCKEKLGNDKKYKVITPKSQKNDHE